MGVNNLIKSVKHMWKSIVERFSRKSHPQRVETPAQDIDHSGIQNLVLTMHSVSGSVLLGFFALPTLDDEKKTNVFISIFRSSNLFSQSVLVIGLAMFFVTYWLLFFAYDEHTGKIRYNQVRRAFLTSLLSITFFIILLLQSVSR